jgi:hypothetical protein
MTTHLAGRVVEWQLNVQRRAGAGRAVQ